MNDPREGAVMENRQAARSGDGLVWVVVVATGELSEETNGDKAPAESRVPAQYRAADEGAEESPLQRTLRHAWDLAPRERICAVVPAEHREQWRRPLWVLPASNVIAQPSNAAVAEGVSQSMQKILERDGAAKVVLLPASCDGHKTGAVFGTARSLLDGARDALTRCVPDPWGRDTTSAPA
jgi:hypothetical protein